MELFIQNDPGAVAVGIKQIRVEALFFCCLSMSHCIAAVMRGAGKPMIPMFIMLGAWCVLRVLYIQIMVPIVQESWVIFSAYPVTWTVSTIAYLIFYFKSDWLHGFDKKKKVLQK
jgi:Na+-driven multidrug efflux pump